MDGSRQDGKAAARGSDLRFIARGFGTYRRDAVLAGLCVFVETSLELLIPFLMSSVIDEGISGASPYVVWTRGAAMLACAAAALLLGAGYARFHLKWMLEWYKANRRYREACALLEDFPAEK